MRLKAFVLALLFSLVPMVGLAQDIPAAPAVATEAAAAPAAVEDAVPAVEGVPVTMVAEGEAVAEGVPAVDTEDAGALISALITAFKQGKWAWAIGLILMLLTWGFNRLLKNRIPKKIVPWVAIGLGVGSNIAMSMATGLRWFEALGSGVTMGLAAIGGWEAIGKIFKSKPA